MFVAVFPTDRCPRNALTSAGSKNCRREADLAEGGAVPLASRATLSFKRLWPNRKPTVENSVAMDGSTVES